MKTVRMALALPAVFLLGTAQLGGQERDQERMPAAGAEQQACEVSFYTVEAGASMQTGPVERTEPPMGPPGPGQENRLDGDQELPLKGEKVMAVPIQSEPLTIWAQVSPRLSAPHDVRVQGGDVQVQQAFALQALGDRTGYAADAPARERQERQGQEAEREIEPAGRTEVDATGGKTSALLLQLDTSTASEGQVELVIQDAMSECTGQIQLVETGAETFPQDDRVDPTDRPEPTTGEGDPDA